MSLWSRIAILEVQIFAPAILLGVVVGWLLAARHARFAGTGRRPDPTSIFLRAIPVYIWTLFALGYIRASHEKLTAFNSDSDYSGLTLGLHLGAALWSLLLLAPAQIVVCLVRKQSRAYIILAAGYLATFALVWLTPSWHIAVVWAVPVLALAQLLLSTEGRVIRMVTVLVAGAIFALAFTAFH